MSAAPQPYAVYWSIYTDLRGRQQFRKLYWDRLKDLIGRPAKLVGIEREELWPSGLPAPELRCHVWRFYKADSLSDAVLEAMRAAFRVAPTWRILIPPQMDATDAELFEIIWDRKPEHAESGQLPLPLLNSIMIGLHRDAGIRIGPGYTVEGRKRRQHRPGTSLVAAGPRGAFEVCWRYRIQTSTKRELTDEHCPRLLSALGSERSALIDVDKRSDDTGPFQLTIRQRFDDATVCEVMSKVFAHAVGMHVSGALSDDLRLFRLTGQWCNQWFDQTQPLSFEVLEV